MSNPHKHPDNFLCVGAVPGKWSGHNCSQQQERAKEAPVENPQKLCPENVDKRVFVAPFNKPFGYWYYSAIMQNPLKYIYIFNIRGEFFFFTFRLVCFRFLKQVPTRTIFHIMLEAGENLQTKMKRTLKGFL